MSGTEIRLQAVHLGALGVVNGARVSYGKEKTELDKADVGLLHALARNGHGSPWEHCVLTFFVRVPIKVSREWMRHRNSYNEISGRYVAFDLDLYEPEVGAVRQQTGKAMAYTFESVDQLKAEEYLDWLRHRHRLLKEDIDYWRQQGIANELLSFEYPLSTYTEFWWTVNFRSLTNFLRLRQDKQALLEFREAADRVALLCWEHPDMRPLMEIWTEEGRPQL